VKQITILAEKMSHLSDYIIQYITDPMVLQPAFLDLVTLKRKESELGFYIMPNYQSIHRVTDIKFNSPAHNSGKVEDGDEIVQINYQTVIGWQYKKVLVQLQESTTDVLLTLKKRPKHSNRIYGHLGLIKLPSKKRSIPYRFDNPPPSPRIELEMTAPELTLPPPKKKEIISDTDESSGNESDVLTPTEIKSSDKELRLYLPKPRAAIQFTRRHTISGNDLSSFKNIGNSVLWHERKLKGDIESTTSLRDKSVSVSIFL
jgi:connector enhancer of kinase suppressor of Ras 2